MLGKDEIDWALGEALAFGSLVLDGTPVRLAGQDTRRGTFSQRHGVLVDQATESEWVPLAHLSDDQAPFMLYDTVLSEYAALGFEYGYSISSDALVCWEAQFGDFANVAQVVIDQFIATAADKWGQRSSLAMLLPHGLEGQGPEHSSARIERYLTLSAEGNLRVVYPTTSAQYFHVLRRQALSARQVPLVCFTPKRYLRMPHSRSPLAAFTDGAFSPVLDDRGAPDVVNRVILCTGMIAHELTDERDKRGASAAIVRIEELYPWPEAQLFSILDRYPDAKQVWWVQPEPANMGAWNYIHIRLHRVLRDRAKLKHVARAPSASPASGSSKVHDAEQQRLLAAAFAKL
jgi:2-oxoglutarate dehydrogenase complex dehydrogenase (E1) component-like enzyme